MASKINGLSKMALKINWLGFAAGAVTLVTLAMSFTNPWWQLTIGQSLIKITASPVRMGLGLFGTQLTVPLVWALNVVMILTFAASGIVMLIYSVFPTKPYAKHLLGFSWKKPLYSVIGFVVGLIIILLIMGQFGLYLPLNSSATVTLPSNWTQGATITALVSGKFQFTFMLALVAAGLCMAAKFTHGLFVEPLVPAEAAKAPVLPAAPVA
jgi:hypothetical protein